MDTLFELPEPPSRLAYDGRAPRHANARRSAWDRAVELADRRAQLERELIEALLCNRVRGLALADAAGIVAGDLEQDDHRCIFAALVTMRGRPVVYVILAARFLLQRFGLWDDGTPRHSMGMRHSLETLCRLTGRGASDRRIPLLIAAIKRLNEITRRAA